MAKRKRRLRAKPGELIAYYGYDEDGEGPDLCVAWGGRGAQSGDGRFLLQDVLSKERVKELADRGYNLSTLKLTIMHKTMQP